MGSIRRVAWDGSTSKHDDTLGLRRGTEFVVEGREGQASPEGEFRARSVIQREAMTLGQLERGERGCTKCCVVAATPDAHFEDVRHCQFPQPWHPCAVLADVGEDTPDCLGDFVSEDPGQGSGAVENDAHRPGRLCPGTCRVCFDLKGSDFQGGSDLASLSQLDQIRVYRNRNREGRVLLFFFARLAPKEEGKAERA